ncbi:hypothetical protein COU61_01860 [Candidatus Pacearchaeota archaeon CG10_big_fil_rev_8_21_14_0_10_35_13]|nr:MAG: hypothetical protein COU61_01860 [Candidatus Pacearchaeota archaeon CG10_big_fil_rev_8_21_14_0_10_35_13]
MKIKNFIKKIDEAKEKSSLDISAWEDLSIGIMNLVSLEEHSFFSYVKTHDEKFLKILETVRELRKKLLALIVKKDGDSEKWCMSKHFLASSMRLFEVGNRLLHEGKEKEAKELYNDASELYGLFWALNIESKGEINIDEKSEESKGIFSSIKKLLECCKE